MERFPNEQEALDLLKKEGASPQVIEHCKAVAALAVDMAEKIEKNGTVVDLNLIKIGALLHDMGRSRTHEVKHGVVGGEILRSNGIDGRLALIAERHVGAGIGRKEAKRLGMPETDFFPETIEEKIICYADKLLVGDRAGTIADARRQFIKDLGKGHPAMERLNRLHEEITGLLG